MEIHKETYRAALSSSGFFRVGFLSIWLALWLLEREQLSVRVCASIWVLAPLGPYHGALL